ncbi:MAG: AAA family ATPase [Coxiellaceae bacterium]|nr:AAA family ATPase [Coxiellaceae bacterium]
MSRMVEDRSADEDFRANHGAVYDQLITVMRQSELTRGAHLKRVGVVLSLRIGKKARLLATKQYISGQMVWVLLELLPNHEYAKAHFLKPGVKQRFFEANADRLTALVLSGDESRVLSIADEAAAGAGAGAGAGACAEPVEVLLYNRELIHLTDTQDECLQRLIQGLSHEQFIGLVAGEPGSGKTLLAKQVIEELLASAAAAPPSVFYIAESEKLRAEMAKQCGLAAAAVQFCGYRDMLAQAGVLLDELEPVGDDQLHQTFAVAQDKAQQALGLAEKSGGMNEAEQAMLLAMTTMSFEQFRQECMVMAGITDQNEKGLKQYQGIGGSHSLLHGNPQLQQYVWTVFQQFMSDLKAHKQYHLKLSRFDVAKLAGNPVLVVDEALDLSRVQLQTLVAMGARTTLLGDYNQDLTHTSHSMEFISQLIRESGVAHTYIGKLTHTYRCATNIARIASQLLRFKQLVISHGSDLVNTVVESALDMTGTVSVVTPRHMGDVEALCNNIHTAVICHDGNKVFAKNDLKTDLLFTVNEIKGLGYNRVVIYDLVSEATAKRLLQIIGGGKKKRNEIRVEDKALITDLNNLFTAVSRAELELIVVNKSSHPAVNQFLDTLLAGVVITPINKVADAVGPSTREEWLQEASRLRREGKLTQAASIEQKYMPVMLDRPAVSEPLHASAVESKREARLRSLAVSQTDVVVAGKGGRQRRKKNKGRRKIVAAPVTPALSVPDKPTAVVAEAATQVKSTDGEFVVSFKVGKKGNRAVCHIDFSVMLTSQQIKLLTNKKVRREVYNKIGINHLRALLLAPVTPTGFNANAYCDFIQSFFAGQSSITAEYLAFAGNEGVLQPVADAAKRIQKSVALQLAHCDIKTRFILVANFLPLMLQIARYNNHLALVVIQHMRLLAADPRGTSSLTRLRIYMLQAPNICLAILDFAAANTLMSREIAALLKQNDMSVEKTKTSILHHICMDGKEPLIAVKLFGLAKNCSYIRDALLEGLWSSDIDLGATAFECLVSSNSQAVLTLCYIAESDDAMMERIIACLDRMWSPSVESASSVAVSIFNAILARCPQAFDRLCMLAISRDQLADKIITLLRNQVFFGELLVARSGVLARLLPLAIMHPEASAVLVQYMNHVDIFSYRSAVAHATDGKPMPFMVMLVIYKQYELSYAAVVELVKHCGGDVVSQFVQLMLMEIGAGNTCLHAVAVNYPEILMTLCQYMLDDARWRGLLPALYKKNDSGVAPLERLPDEQISTLRESLRALQAGDTAGVARDSLSLFSSRPRDEGAGRTDAVDVLDEWLPPGLA